MNKQYIDIPDYTTLYDIINKNYTLSATQYKTFNIKNKNLKKVADFLSRELKRKDLGQEVGSESYVEKSNYFFIKTKALQKESYILDFNKESIQNIMPKNYIKMDLRKGDLIISKDSNVGEVVILDKDYPNTMLCGGIYKLPIQELKYYLLAFIKSEVFRQQIDFLVPRGSTIRHGKTKFLECLIPIPNKNRENTIQYVEILMQTIIQKEIEIKKKFEESMNLIKTELKINQKEVVFKHSFPWFNEIKNTTRLDSSLYSQDFKEKIFLLDNYIYGTKSIGDLGFSFIRGNNLAQSVIGKSIYSDIPKKGFYTLILPTNISSTGTLNKIEYLGNKKKLITINKGSIIFGAEGTFRSTVFFSDEKAITNFHGLTLYNKSAKIQKSIFVKLMLDYFREEGICRACATGGNGGSLSIEYWKYLKFPNFPESVEYELTKKYYNPDLHYIPNCKNVKSFIDYNTEFDKVAGIYNLDEAAKYLKVLLQEAVDNIINDLDVKLSF